MDEHPPSGSPASNDRTVVQWRHGEAEIRPGTVLGNTYALEAVLRRSPMGDLYRARHIELGTTHTIKVIAANLADDPRMVALLVEEARKLRGARHPAVVGYEGLFRDDHGLRYLVMEFVEGLSLSSLLAGRRLEPDEVLRLGTRIGDGLAAVHARGIVHRDISPENILVPDGDVAQAKLTEFGFAKSADAGDATVIGINFETRFAYASPEQLGLFGGRVDLRSDLYSFGLVLAAAAIGFGKTLNMGTTFPEAIAARRKVPDLSPLPARLRALIEPLVAPKPDDRPASVRTWLEAAQPSNAAARAERQARSGGKLVRTVAVLGGAALIVAALAAASLLLRGQDKALSADAIRATLATLTQSYQCASLDQVVAGDGSVRLTGHVASEEDLSRLQAEIAAIPKPAPAAIEVEIMRRPHCEVAAVLQPIAEHAGRDTPSVEFLSNSREARIGDRLALAVRTPRFDSYIYVDYFDSGGQVLHLFPNARDRFNFRPWRNRFVLFRPPLRSCWIFSGQLGRELITLVATAKPLGDARHPDIETATDYIARLGQDLSRLPADQRAAVLFFFDLQAPLPWVDPDAACPAG